MLWYNLAHELEDRGDIAGAWKAFHVAADLDPLSSDAHTMLGIIALRSNQLDLAAENLKLALAGRSPSSTAHHNYAMLLLNNGSMSAAIGHLKSAIQLQPDMHQAYEMLGMALAESEQPSDTTIVRRPLSHARRTRWRANQAHLPSF